MSLGAGKLHPGSNKDKFLVGMHTNTLAYDVDDNSDVFYKEVGEIPFWSKYFANRKLLVKNRN